jgi:hypothetical protein
MSQQYAPPPGPPPAPAPGGWGPGPGTPGPSGPAGPGGWGPGPRRPQYRQGRSSRNQWIIMGCAVLAVVLVAVGVVLLVTGGGKDDDPVAQQTPDPVGTLYTPSPTPTPNDARGRTTPASRSDGVSGSRRPRAGCRTGQVQGREELHPPAVQRPRPDRRVLLGPPDRAVRREGLRGAPGRHRVERDAGRPDRQGRGLQAGYSGDQACYALSYTGVWVAKNGKKVAMQGFVTAYQDQYDRSPPPTPPSRPASTSAG